MMKKTFIAQLLRARIAGHPIHSMLVHFPSALFPMSLLCDVIAWVLKNSCLACAGFYCLGAGIFFGIFAAFFGAIDYANLSPKHSAWNKASWHGLLNVLWLMIFSIEFGMKLKHFSSNNIATLTEMMIASIAVIGLVFSNYMGGDLVFRHRLGVHD